MSAIDHQRVCGAECRLARRRKLARRRRARRVQDFRVDERERQRISRARRREVAEAAGTAAVSSGSHAPACTPNRAKLIANLLDSWDVAVAMSRAGLQRKLAVILRQSRAPIETVGAAESARSRAGLGP